MNNHFTTNLAFIVSTDMDECGMSNVHNCSMGCQNTYGSFNCTCNSGFELDSDGRNCNGKVFVCVVSFNNTV